MKKPLTFKTKLWLYFVIFAAIVFSVLWLLQTVFLQSFYNMMLIRNTNSAAVRIAETAGSEGITKSIDEIALDNSLLIYITDTQGNVLYVSDEYKNAYSRKHGYDMGRRGFDNKARGTESNVSKLIKEKKDNDKRNGDYRSLPDDYDAFLDGLKASPDGTFEYSDDSVYVYGTYIDYYGSEGKSVLYVSSTLNPVGSAVSIIRIQLGIVTVFSLIIGFILAWLIARRFARPVSKLSDKARLLGDDGYDGGFKKGFCAELDELNDTLDETSGKLRMSKSFQNELLASVSHDLRTPLTMIKGYAEEVGEHSWSDEAQRKEDIGIIIREADRLTALVNEILEYSELKSRDDHAEHRKTNLGELAESVADSFDSLYKRSGFVIEKDIQLGLLVDGNPGQLERAVFNLMDNAIRHAGAAKTVRIRVFEACDAAGSRCAVLEVTDFGGGIPESDLPYIWDKYYTSRQRGGKGTSGLGLAIVKQIALLHNAEYGVVSRPGDGSSFYLVFR